MDQQVPKQIQDKIAQYQTLQGQVQMTSVQKQQLYMKSAEVENALKSLETAGDEKVYMAAGPLLVSTTKEDSLKKLKDDKELIETRMKMLEKQEAKLAEKLQELQVEIQEMLKPMGGGGITDAG